MLFSRFILLLRQLSLSRQAISMDVLALIIDRCKLSPQPIDSFSDTIECEVKRVQQQKKLRNKKLNVDLSRKVSSFDVEIGLTLSG